MLGTRAFLPTLLAQLTNAAPSPIPLDPVIFQSILLVLAAGHRKHLILRAVDPEEVGIIARTAEWTLSTVFNLATHRLKIRAGKMSTDASEFIDTAAFLRSLFLSSSSSADALHDERTSSCGSIAQLAHQRNSSGHKKHGSASGSTGYADASADSPVSHPAQLDPALPTSPYSHRRTSHTRHSASSQHSKSKSKSRKPSATVPTAHPQIPDALVVTGLEHACDMSQRALVRVLAEGRVTFPKNTRVGGWSEPQTREDDEEEGWDLPENFIMVYVTSWDPRERPAIHKSLLDKFSMSTNITIPSKIRKALRSISISSITTATSPHHHSHSMPSTPRSALGSLPPHPFPRSPTPLQQVVPLSQGTSNTSKSSTTNPFSAEHDHYRVPSISTYQGTHSPPRTHSVSPFLSSVPLPSEADPLLHPAPSRPLAAASIAPKAEPSPGLPLPAIFLPRLRHVVAHCTCISPSLNLYLQDLFTAARFDFPELDGTLLTARAMDDAEKLSRACRVLGTELGGWELIRGAVMNGEVGERSGENDGQGGEGDGNSVNGQPEVEAARRWEFETGYDPSGTVVIDVRIDDAPVDEDTNKMTGPPNSNLALDKRQSSGNGPFRVVFDETLSRIAEPSIRSAAGDPESEDATVDTLDVSEADVARIVPRVVSHRVRMRDDWMDQVMAGVVFRATSSVGSDIGGGDVARGKSAERRRERDGSEPEVEGEMTVKDVLVRVLQRSPGVDTINFHPCHPPTNAIRQKRALPEPDEIFSRLKRSKIATTAPSITAKPEVFELLQLELSEKIFDDRPNPDPDIPSVALLYEGFGHFLDIMDGRGDVPGLTDINVKRLYIGVDTFASEMNKNYENENDRRDAILPCLTRIFSTRRGIQIPELHAEPIGSVGTDGHNIATHGAGTIVVEFKNNITGINAIPQVELACYVARLYSTKVDEQLYLRWRIPCLGLTIVGCELTFYAVIAIDHRFKLVSLTPTFSCNQSASDGRDRKSLYLAFTAASVLQAQILQDVEKLQNNLPQEIPLKARRFPVVTKLRKYPSSSDDHLNFEIQDVFPDRQPYRFLYVAATPDDQLVLIKFVRQYSIELHHFCAESGYAPRILAFEKLPGGWHAVAMEFIESGFLITASPQLSTHRDRWAKELRCLMDRFHLEGFVHGDLRDANIFCKEESVMLLDFDWGGKNGEVFYPTANLNNELQEGRVSDDLRITKDDTGEDFG
ncbi:hypothetical protein APHAL10511_008159 [Amanita phalloides]|nr:hypothetical protein APHAL10511_008159 [Amanita phalloides]